MKIDGVSVVPRKNAAAMLSVPLKKIDVLVRAGQLRCIHVGGEEYLILADIEALDKKERESRSRGPRG